MWLVYLHKSPSNKVYIGITSKDDPNKRWCNGHGYKKNRQPLFYNAVKKYGWNNFEHRVLFKDITEKDAKLIEIDLIYYYKKINLSYNMTDGGDGTCGKANSEHARKLISEAQTKFSVEQYDLNGNFIARYDSMTDASKAIGKAVYKNNHWHLATGIPKACKTGTVAYGYRWKFTSEDKLYISKNKTLKEVVQLSLDNKFIAKFSSGVDAQNKTGISHKLISACCTGKRKTTKGFKWMYYNTYKNTCMNLQEDPINIKYDNSDKNKEIS